MRVVVFILGLVMATTAGAQDCGCGTKRYIQYELNQKGLEFDENSWRVVKITHFDIDLRDPDEPELCEVRLDLIPPTDKILYQDFRVVPGNDFELNYEEVWSLASQFEAELKNNHCLVDQKLS